MRTITIELSEDEYADLEAAAHLWHWGRTASDAARHAVRNELGAYRWEMRKMADPEGAKADREKVVAAFVRARQQGNSAFSLGSGAEILHSIDEAISRGYSEVDV